MHEFKDDLVFTHEDTGKNLLMYCDNQQPCMLTDENGIECEITDKSGCCILPTTYVLGKAEEYAELISDESSARAIYQE